LADFIWALLAVYLRMQERKN